MEQQDSRVDYLINMSDEKSKDWSDFKMQKAKEIANKVVDCKLPKVDFYEREEIENRQVVSVCQDILKEYGESFCIFLHEDSSFKEKLRKKFQYYKIDCYWEIKDKKGKTGKELCFTPDAFRKFELVPYKTKEVKKCKSK